MKHPANSATGHVSQGVVPAQCVRMTGEIARVAAHSRGSTGEPLVELIRDADAVRAIDVTCTCGRRIRLNCVY